MGKFDERSLRMRKEQIDLYGDGSVTVVISRPERRALSYQEQVKNFDWQVRDLAKTAKPYLCFDPTCDNNALSAYGHVVICTVKEGFPHAMVAAACAECSKKSSEEILGVLRTSVAKYMGRNEIDPDDMVPMSRQVEVKGKVIRGIQVVVPTDVGDYPPVFEEFCEHLLVGKLARFEFGFRGAHNCGPITRHLYQDFRELGIEDRYQYKQGFCTVLTKGGHPIGEHRWVERDGWVIDAANGALDIPVIFQRAEDYYRDRQMTDIKDIPLEADEVAQAAE